MNKNLIVDASESDRRLMAVLLVKSGYEPIAVETMEAVKDEVAKLPPGAVIVADASLRDGSAKELIIWQKAEFRQSRNNNTHRLMKKILIFLMAIVTLAVTTPAFATSRRSAFGAQQRKNRSIMELPLFERAVLIIKKFETLHKLCHSPYVGYGYQVRPGEQYRRGCQLTEAQADALLRKDLAKFCSLYSQYGKNSVLLGALAYNCGTGVVNKSTVLKKS